MSTDTETPLARRSWLGARWTGFWETAHDDVEALSELELSGGHPNAVSKHTRVPIPTNSLWRLLSTH